MPEQEPTAGKPKPNPPRLLRAKSGRFLPQRGTRPAKNLRKDYLKVVASECSLAQWQRIVRVAVFQAAAGDAQARQWLSKYVTPKKDLTLLVEHEEAEKPLEILLKRASVRDLDQMARPLESQVEGESENAQSHE